MLGLPASPGAVGAAMLALGVLLGAAAAYQAWRRWFPGWEPAPALALTAALGVTVASVPFGLWRMVEDLRFTTRLNDEQVEGAGPIQTFIPPYILDDVRPLIPREDTYVTMTGPDVREELARTAFRYLALTALFPRVAAEDAADADWVIAWGGDPRESGVDVEDVRVVRPAEGQIPAVVVARVA
jgi:hypothetical protein